MAKKSKLKYSELVRSLRSGYESSYGDELDKFGAIEIIEYMIDDLDLDIVWDNLKDEEEDDEEGE
jgi:hypothetical protein